jgi:hypothetical protein
LSRELSSTGPWRQLKWLDGFVVTVCIECLPAQRTAVYLPNVPVNPNAASNHQSVSHISPRAA